MPTIRQSPESDTELVQYIEESLEATPKSVLGQYSQTTPVPIGPDSAELVKIMSSVRRSLEQLATIQPFLGTAHDPLLAMLGHSRESGEASFDYERLPPAQTVSTDTKFFVRGRGKPKPYPLEDE